MSTFAERLLLAWQSYERQAGGKVSGTKFADAIGVSKSWLSEWQGEDEAPPHARIIAISKATGVDPGWLAYGDDCQAPMEKEWPKGRGSDPNLPRLDQLPKDTFTVLEPGKPLKKKGKAG